jgi:3-oxoacyl-[acyl-carrier-protein] synthase III
LRASVFIAGSGTYLPGNPIPFDRIDEVLGPLEDAPHKIQRWMENTRPVMAELLDIAHVHYAIDPVTGEFTDDNVTMSVKAAREALAQAAVDPSEIDLICYGSAHQDQMPTASVRIQEALGIPQVAELSIHANCTSAYKAIHLAHALLESGRYETALVLSSNVASSELRADYYNQRLVDRESLFLRWFLSDGAGALVLSVDPKKSRGFEIAHTYIESIGLGREPLMFNERPALWMNPKQEYDEGRHHLRQRFRGALATDVFQEPGGSIFLCGFKRMVAAAEVDLGDIKLFQINLPTKHIADSVKEEMLALGLAPEVFYSKLDALGYSGPPMALICLDKIVREERLQSGDKIASFVTEVSKFMQAGYVIDCHAERK